MYKEFEKVIDQVYERLEGEAGPEGKRRVEGEAKAKAAVRELIGKTIERPTDRLEDDTDLFGFGLDSLQSSRIRNAIQRACSSISCWNRRLIKHSSCRRLIWVERSCLSMPFSNILPSPSTCVTYSLRWLLTFFLLDKAGKAHLITVFGRGRGGRSGPVSEAHAQSD